MSRHLSLSLVALSALLLAIACGPEPPSVPAAEQPTMPAALPATLPATEPIPTPSPAPPEGDLRPSATPTALPPTEPPPTSLPAPSTATGANADVLHVRAVEAADGSWTFHVTVEHPDTGWGDYADGWDVLTPDGVLLKPDPDSPFTRLLVHPHVDEQPFTRSQSGIVIPAGVTQVRVRAHDLVDGFGGREVLVDLTLASGEGFEVERSESEGL